jgi:protein gp37
VSDKSAIEWTDATWNPVTGCTKVSPGCDHCYAETFAERFRGTPGHHFENGFDLTLRPERLGHPLAWKKPKRIFVNSMSDLFHDDIPDEYIAKVWETMAATPQHTYQLLTKRHARMRSFFTRWPNAVLTNLWLGVSVEDQKWADIRIPTLLDTPAAVRWISAEPLLGPVDLTNLATHSRGPVAHWEGRDQLNTLTGVPRDPAWKSFPGLDWVVVGGESGREARPMDPDWARSLRDQCTKARVPFLFKQWGGVNKKATGRELDGRTWDEYPA